MVKYGTECVGCGLPCLGGGCPYYRVPFYYCDECGDDGADYIIDDQDLCEDCAKKYLLDVFNDLPLTEQAKLLDIRMEERD